MLSKSLKIIFRSVKTAKRCNRLSILFNRATCNIDFIDHAIHPSAVDNSAVPLLREFLRIEGIPHEDKGTCTLEKVNFTSRFTTMQAINQQT